MASNRLRGRKGDDILYGGSGGDDVLIGGRGRDQFWIDAQPGSFAKVKDFRPGKDQLVFSVSRKDLSFESVGNHLLVRHEDISVARLLGVSSISWERDVLFRDFEAM